MGLLQFSLFLVKRLNSRGLIIYFKAVLYFKRIPTEEYFINVMGYSF